MAEAAAEAGADAIKFQLHDSPSEMVRDAPAPSHFAAESRWDYYLRTAFSDEQWATLKERCEAAAIEFFCSAFSVEAVERLERLGVRRHKLPSGEVSNVELVRRMAATSKPLLISSGMSSNAEVARAGATATGVYGGVTTPQCT